MLFASETHPKGPNTKILETRIFDVSGARIQVSIPKGNCREIPSPEGIY
jgi:hypothetical protein